MRLFSRQQHFAEMGARVQIGNQVSQKHNEHGVVHDMGPELEEKSARDF